MEKTDYLKKQWINRLTEVSGSCKPIVDNSDVRTLDFSLDGRWETINFIYHVSLLSVTSALYLPTIRGNDYEVDLL